MKKKLTVFLALLLISIVMLTFVIIINYNFKNKEKNNNSTNTLDETEEFVQIQEDGLKKNISVELNKNKKLGVLEITNIRLTNNEEQTVLLADVKNTGDTTTELTAISIKILDKQKNVIGTLEGLIDHIAPNETTQLNIATQDDFVNAYNFEVSKSN